MRSPIRVAILSLALLLLPISVASAAPKGAKKLAARDLIQGSGYWCGKISNKWIPGKLLSGGYFYSHAAERTNILAQAANASASKKKSLTQQAAQLKTFITQRTPVCVNLAKKPLRFSLSTASGVALKASAGGSGASIQDVSSNLQKVNEDGSLSNVLTSGDATFDRILVAPGNRLFVVFKTKTNISDTADSSNGCWVAEVNRATGVPTCVESDFKPSWIFGDLAYHNPSIQFDQDGNPHYYGMHTIGTGPSAKIHALLRKRVGDQKIDIVDIEQNGMMSALISDFLVIPDGTVFYTGVDNNTLELFTRRVTPAGNAKLLWPYQMPYMVQLPDENIYFGRNAYLNAIVRYILASDSVDPRFWVAYATPEDVDQPYQNSYPYCVDPSIDAFCGHNGAYIRGYVTTDSGKSFISAGQHTTNFETSLGSFTQIYPILAHPTTIVKKVFHMQKYGNKIILMGLDASNKNVMTLYDTDDNSELGLITAQDDIEVFRAQHSSTGNTIIFDGQRKSDNKYVTGAFDLDTAALSVNVLGNTALSDLAAFQ